MASNVKYIGIVSYQSDNYGNNFYYESTSSSFTIELYAQNYGFYLANNTAFKDYVAFFQSYGATVNNTVSPCELPIDQAYGSWYMNMPTATSRIYYTIRIIPTNGNYHQIYCY